MAVRTLVPGQRQDGPVRSAWQESDWLDLERQYDLADQRLAALPATMDEHSREYLRLCGVAMADEATWAVAVADPMAHAAAMVADWDHMILTLRRSETLLGNIVIVLNPRTPPDSLYRASCILVECLLRRRWVFYYKRWEKLEAAFRRWQRGYNFDNDEDAWHNLVLGYFIIARAESYPYAPTLDRVFAEWRRRLRPMIEKELLGHTLDSRMRTVPLDQDPPAPDELFEMMDSRVELLLELSDDQLELLGRYYSPDCDREVLARELRVRPGTLRTRISRALGNLR